MSVLTERTLLHLRKNRKRRIMNYCMFSITGSVFRFTLVLVGSWTKGSSLCVVPSGVGGEAWIGSRDGRGGTP